MKFKLLVVFVAVVFRVAGQDIDLKSFDWSISSDSISVEHIDPSDVYLALLSGNVIEAPFFGDNEKRLQWVAKKDWTFETGFALSEQVIQKEKAEMVFEGLDTYADVYLNDTLVLHADNMFRTWVVDVKKVLKCRNRLKIVFTSPLKVIKRFRDSSVWQLPYDYGYVRKAPYQFGWDWGPVFVTGGIWRKAYLRTWSRSIINDVYISQKHIESTKAEVDLQITIDATAKEEGDLLIFRDSVLTEKHKITLSPGSNRFVFSDVIENPRLWWPNGMGKPNMYEYSVLLEINDRIISGKRVKTGLRTIKLVQQPDTAGKSFYFTVNDLPVFMKGANYIPPDNFLPRVTVQKYDSIITEAKNAHMNMLRVWGGGTYENDIFYTLCDENGILIWQDFMFAGNMLPGDSAFIENIKQEAVDNVVRLRNHPSIALWCGNNEVDEAWHNWGWQKQFNYSTDDSVKLWSVYRQVFENLLPQIVHRYAPPAFYWPSSPSTGWGHPQAYQQGDVHYWGVWWGKAPFAQYEKNVGRFMSEYGFQGMPSMKTIKTFTLPADRKLISDVLDAHQKHPFGWKSINEYMERDFPVPDNLEEYDYVSQLLQAEGISIAIEAHRRAKPFCMGTLYWQLNDCWPVVSWASVDYYGRWKAMHYKVKKLYKRELISFDGKTDSLNLWIVTDDVKAKKCFLHWSLINFDGTIRDEQNKTVELKANSAGIYDVMNLEKTVGADTASVVLKALLLSDDSVVLAENYHYFTKPKFLKLLKPGLSVKTEKVENGFLITLNSGYIAKGVRLSTLVKGFFSDNYFDLFPDEPKRILFKTNEILKPETLKIKSLFDVKN